MARPKPVMLIVLDGWGLREEREHNAVRLASTPTMDSLARRGVPYTTLRASGRAVGLPEGQMGNSEVGHLNLGAGRVVDQDIVRIDKAIETGAFFENKTLRELIRSLKESGGRLHLLGLLSDGGVHSLQSHLHALLEMAKRGGVSDVFIHAFLDGRDTSPHGGAGYLRELQEAIARVGSGRVATVQGRYYAMDRDRRWDRVRKAWGAMVLGEGRFARDPLEAIERSYAEGVTDEFVLPAVIAREGEPPGTIREGDGVFCFNFRADRMRQITRALMEEAFDGFPRPSFPRLRYATMTSYHEDWDYPVAFPPARLKGVFGHALAGAGLTNLRVAETEKYPHVTFFFNGGEDHEFPGERRVLVPSPKVATYDLKPEMNAPEVTEEVLKAIREGRDDAIVLNFANPDMVGHTGVLEAAIKAVETADACLGRVLALVEEKGGAALVTADHGNCEQMWDPETNGPHTAHTTNPTPCFLLAPGFRGKLRGGGALCDVAPTLLGLLEVKQPPEMTGMDLRSL